MLILSPFLTIAKSEITEHDERGEMKRTISALINPIVVSCAPTAKNNFLILRVLGVLSLALFLLLFFPFSASAKQAADTMFKPIVEYPLYEEGQGPTVYIDAAHHNFHTLTGRYQGFAEVLYADGFNVKASETPLIVNRLKTMDILVISNALNERNVKDWSLPTPSAFTEEEIDAVHQWVTEGGSVLLIADHMPMPGAAEKLAAAFGFIFNNGYAVDAVQGNMDIFNRMTNTLVDHPIVQGLHERERIDSVRSFTGQAFRAEPGVEPLMVFGEGYVSLMPQKAGEFDSNTPRIPVKGWLQGATKHVGKGRVAVFGEAAMFTSQKTRSGSFGLTSPGAEQNQQFLLNIMHWLSGKL